jgi:hypothetical protein
MNFDNITIPDSPTSKLYLWKMPAKMNFTGIIGLIVEGSLENYVDFSTGTDALAPSFQNGGGNTVTAYGSLQIPAQNGTGNDYWYFLFSSSPHMTNPLPPLNVGFYIIEMQTVEENVTTDPITLFTSQMFLFKVYHIGNVI